MATPQSALKRRLTQVYVEIPPSLLDLSKYQPLSKSRSSRVERVFAKENLLMFPLSRRGLDARSMLKRKAPNDIIHSSGKKPRQNSFHHEKTASDAPSGANVAGFPNGFVYCHQCSQRRDLMASVQCTNLTPLMSGDKSTAMMLRCSTKYCKSCLNNRYGEDISQVKNSEYPVAELTSHAEGQGYIFKCPKCKNTCNCGKCRKPKVELLNKTAKAAKGDGPALRIQDHNHPAANDVFPVKNKPTKKKGMEDKGIAREPVFSIPKWTKLHIPLDLPAVEDRIYIREFMLRFGRIMNPPIHKSQLEELEFIGGGFRDRNEYELMASWVSESCVRSMVLGILSLLAPESPNTEVMKSVTKDIRSMGTNLNKVWNTLQQLRDLSQSAGSASNCPLCLTFPDPLPPPLSATVPKTRSMHNAQGNARILCSGQMVPVLRVLIDHAVATKVVRAEIEAGHGALKELTRRIREATKLENERWEKIRETLDVQSAARETKGTSEEKRILRDLHKRRLLSIDKAFNVVSSNYAARVATLGQDDQGRQYWMISPGINEISAAEQFIKYASSEEPSKATNNCKRSITVPEAPSGSKLKEWPWILAVWGQLPTGNKIGTCEDPDGSDSNDDQEKWWAFGEVEEIRNLANWLGRRNDSTSKSSTEVLAKRIADFADLLEWRSRANRYSLVN